MIVLFDQLDFAICLNRDLATLDSDQADLAFDVNVERRSTDDTVIRRNKTPPYWCRNKTLFERPILPSREKF